jgi:hypothetical protein
VGGVFWAIRTDGDKWADRRSSPTRFQHLHPVEPEVAGCLAGLAPAEEVDRNFAGIGQFRGILVAHPVWTEIGGKQQRGQHGADSARLGAAGVSEGERTAFADVPQDDLAKIPLMGVFMVGQVLGENLQLRDLPPLLQPFGILDGGRAVQGARRWLDVELHGLCRGNNRSWQQCGYEGLEEGSADHGGGNFQSLGLSAADILPEGVGQM